MSSPKCAVARCRWIAVFGLMVSGFVLAAPASGQQKEATPPATAPPAAPAPTAAPVSGSPVIVNGKTLFVIQEGYFAFTADARATAIEARIENLSRLPQSRIAAIRTYDEESTTAIADGTQVIMTITEKDAQAAKRSRTELAADYAQRIRVAAEALRKQYSLKTLVIAALWALLATGVLLGLLKLFSMAFKALNRGIKSWHGKYIRSIRIQKLELLPAARITALLLLLSRLLRAALVLVALYLYISVTFSLFPWTQGYTNILMGYVTYPLNRVSEAFLSFVPNLFFIAVILLVAYYVTKAVRFLFEAVEKESITIPGFYRDWARPTYKIARFLICAFTLVIVFPYLPGSKSPAFQGVSIFFGLLLSLGSSSAVSNVVAGTVLTYTRAFQLGDRVKIGETIGDVIEKTLLVTRVRTIKNVDISIPNSMVLGSHIVNYSSGDDAH
ncbi:MAG TPA: mechanosensitive ion channel domain-containing protein, partial [Candidatus Dormibacteraeota bacterium]|nr:mechanosensitive ion channel domain-containing protein [Candidatus Dormibacteraeota bacterium]